MGDKSKVAAERAEPAFRTRTVADPPSALQRRHLLFGWWSLLGFLSLGVVLEALHGFKAGFYLDVGNETRRLLWTLSHAHGTLLALIHLGFAATLRCVPETTSLARASASLLAAAILLPGGFFLGGLFSFEGDPGIGVLLVPPGALLLFVGVLLTARAVGRLPRAASPPSLRESPGQPAAR